MSEQSIIGRDIAWYERRHVQLARRVACLRRNIKQLQRAHDAAVNRWLNAQESIRRSRDYYVGESNRLNRLLDEAKKPRDASAALVGSVMVLAISTVVLLFVLLWKVVA